MDISIIKNAKTKYLGKHIMYFEEIDSTQEEAKRQLKKGNLPSGTIVLADWQTAGQGTKMRKWYASKGENIIMTIVIQPHWHVGQLQGLTVAIAKAIQTAIRKGYGYVLDIKEPNDLLLHGKKICGILTQATTREEIVSQLWIGIGLNVNEEQFVEEIQHIATSLKKEYHITFKREEVIACIIEELEKILG